MGEFASLRYLSEYGLKSFVAFMMGQSRVESLRRTGHLYYHLSTSSSSPFPRNGAGTDRASAAARVSHQPFTPTIHAATHPGVGGGTHRRRATFKQCSVFVGGDRLGIWGVVLLVCVSGVSFSVGVCVCVCVCVCDRLILFLH